MNTSLTLGAVIQTRGTRLSNEAESGAFTVKEQDGMQKNRQRAFMPHHHHRHLPVSYQFAFEFTSVQSPTAAKSLLLLHSWFNDQEWLTAL